MKRSLPKSNGDRMKDSSIKKLAMLQYWRISQIAPIVNLVMLSITLTLIVYNYIAWRGGIFGHPYVGIIIIWLLIVSAVFFAGFIWDKSRMWWTLQVVLQEKTPYTYSGKVTAKEVWQYLLVWLPTLDVPSNPEGMKRAKLWKQLLKHNLEYDKDLKKKVNEIGAIMGINIDDFL